MSMILNKGTKKFEMALNTDIYVDKSMLIEMLSKHIRTERRFICVSRPRRFGKSMAADMLNAYFGRKCSSRQLFEGLKISGSPIFEKYLNKFNVLLINLGMRFDRNKPISDMLNDIVNDIREDIVSEYPDIDLPDDKPLPYILQKVFNVTGIQFVILIDEWDCVFRITKNNTAAQTEYLDFLRRLLKDQEYIALAYMTGILPIKKYGEHSALNIFTEVSMTNPREYTEFMGFTEDEVKALCEQYDMPYEETKRWYDGYTLKGISLYNPQSVVMSLTGRDYDNYWTQTETFEALRVYIDSNVNGLREKIIQLIGGEEIEVVTRKFQNDMVTFETADDVLTLLVHLGYLSYDFDSKTVRIPNLEIYEEFIATVSDDKWKSIADAINDSKALLKATVDGDEETVAAMIDRAHSENSSILKYNDENSLACVITIAYYYAKKDYAVYREMPAGKGYADLVFIPKINSPLPAVVVELKHNASAETAIEQIKRREYKECLKAYSGEVILTGISYLDKEKKHICKIERIVK